MNLNKGKIIEGRCPSFSFVNNLPLFYDGQILLKTCDMSYSS